MYRGAQDCFCQLPSIAASFGSWFFVTAIAICAPKTNTCSTAMTVKNFTAIEKFFLANSWCRFFSWYQALTDRTSAAPTIHDATHVWSNRGRNDGVNTTDPKFGHERLFAPLRHPRREPLRASASTSWPSGSTAR